MKKKEKEKKIENQVRMTQTVGSTTRSRMARMF